MKGRGVFLATVAANWLACAVACADPSSASAPVAAQPPRATVTTQSDPFLANAAALDSAIRLGDPSATRFVSDASAGGFRADPPSITLRYRLVGGSGLSPYVAATLATVVSDPHAGGVSLSLHRGAAIAFGFDTDASGQSRVNLDIGVKQALAPGKMLDHRSIDPWVMGAGVGMRF